MRIGLGWVVALMAATSAHGQDSPNIPAGSPLGAVPLAVPPEQAQAEARRAQRQATARAQANRQAMAEAFAAPTPPALDEGRAPASASTFGQTVAPAQSARAAPPLYGGYYQIRTPWDRR